MSRRTCTGHRSLGPCYISVGIRRQCQHKTGPWYLLTILIRSGTWFGLWDESRNSLSFTFPNSQNSKMFSPVTSRVVWWAGVAGTGMVFLGITRSLIYVEVLRVTDIVQTSGVVYPASRRRLSHRSHNEQFSALTTASRRSDRIKRNLYRKRLDPGSASLSQAARWDQRMTP